MGLRFNGLGYAADGGELDVVWLLLQLDWRQLDALLGATIAEMGRKKGTREEPGVVSDQEAEKWGALIRRLEE